jgi:hypothetical protein
MAFYGQLEAYYAVVVPAALRATAFRNLWLLLCHWLVAGPRPLPEVSLDNPRAPRVPYGLAIAAGALMTIWLR